MGGQAGPASATTATKHVGTLMGHASMFQSTNAAATAIPLTSPDRLVLPGAETRSQLLQPQTSLALQQQQQTGASLSSQHPQQEQYPTLRHHPGSAAAQRNIQNQFLHQQQIHHQQIQHQQQIQMQLQMQQQQQAIAMMLHQQQQQQQQQQKLHLQKELESKQGANIDNQKEQYGQDDWHEGLEEEFLRQQEALGDDFDEEGIHAITGGAGIEELAAAWAEAEAEYDNVLLDHEQQQQLGEGGTLLEDDYANLWQGDSNLPVANKPYEFINAVDPDDQASKVTKKNYMEEGMRHFREGNIKEAIESFEMELQVQNSDNAMAWRMLGKCHAENDQDPEAIQCLEAAVDRDPFCPEALLALGVSYVNELNHERALENMKAWFTHNPKYAGMELPASRSAEDDIYGAAPEKAADLQNGDDEDDLLGSHRSAKESAFGEVKSMLLGALEFDPTDAGDVYEALGVIYNVIKDYDAAVDAFRKALESRPDDHQLWNKLGATLANGSQSEQALPTYHQSLKLKPKYARAWLNMAISHSNLQNHDEAARCYLQTLSLNPAATHCWTYLRMSLSSNERWDLLPLVFERNLSGFQDHFDFVLY